MSAPLEYFRNRRVFLTGHTGFKGAWLALWLAELGAEVHGFALTPPTEPSLFAEAGIGEAIAASTFADIRDQQFLINAVRRAEPEMVFHLAAQSLVPLSHREP